MADDSADWNFGTGDFTIDFRVRFDALKSANFLSHFSSLGWEFEYVASMRRLGFTAEGADLMAETWDPVIGTWYHLALTRSKGALSFFVDGRQFGSVKQYTGEPIDAPTTLVVYPGADGRSFLYEDDGHSLAYQRNDWMKIEMAWRDGARRLTLGLQQVADVVEHHDIAGLPALRHMQARYMAIQNSRNNCH